MPAKDGLRLNDLSRTKQARPEPGHPDQQGPVTAAQSKTRRCTPQGDAKLMAKEQVLRFKPARRLEEVDDEHCERMQEREHRPRDHAMILPDDSPDAIFGRDRFSIHIRGAICAWVGNCLIRPGRQQVEYQLRTPSRSAVDTRLVASPGWWALFRTETAYWPRFRSGLTFGRTTVRWKASQFSRDS
jgi:hypothetical protein